MCSDEDPCSRFNFFLLENQGCKFNNTRSSPSEIKVNGPEEEERENNYLYNGHFVSLAKYEGRALLVLGPYISCQFARTNFILQMTQISS